MPDLNLRDVTPAAPAGPGIGRGASGKAGRAWISVRRMVLRNRAPVVLVLLALAVYAPGIGWGIPSFAARDRMHSWGNDDLVPLAPLAEMYNTFVRPEPNRNVAYPWFQYFLVAAAYGPYLVYLKATGRLEAPSSTYPFGIEDPEPAFRAMTYMGRSVSLLLALALVLAVYYAGLVLWNRRAGVCAAAFAMVLFPMVYYARTGNPDVAVLAWTGLGLAACASILRRGLTAKRGAALGIFLALAVATKDQAVGSFAFVLPALLWVHARRPGAAAAGKVRPVLAMVGSCAAAYVLASGAVVDPQRFVQHTALVLSAGSGSTGLYNRHPATAEGYFAQLVDLLRYLVEVTGWPLLLLALAGIVLAVRRDRLALLLLLSSAGFLAMLLPVRFSRIHYLLPVALPLTLFAGYAATRALEAPRTIRLGGYVAAALAFGLLLLQAVDLTHAMIRDSRYAAAEWFEAHARPGDRVLYFGASMRNPPLRADVMTEGLEVRDQARSKLAEGTADFVIIMPDDTNEDRHRVEWREGRYSVHSDYMHAEDFEALVDGGLGYRLVAKFQTPRLFPWLPRPFLSYPTVNPPIQIFVREDRAAGMPRLDPWWTAPHYPEPRGQYEPVVTRADAVRP